MFDFLKRGAGAATETEYERVQRAMATLSGAAGQVEAFERELAAIDGEIERGRAKFEHDKEVIAQPLLNPLHNALPDVDLHQARNIREQQYLDKVEALAQASGLRELERRRAAAQVRLAAAREVHGALELIDDCERGAPARIAASAKAAAQSLKAAKGAVQAAETAEAQARESLAEAEAKLAERAAEIDRIAAPRRQRVAEAEAALATAKAQADFELMAKRATMLEFAQAELAHVSTRETDKLFQALSEIVNERREQLAAADRALPEAVKSERGAAADVARVEFDRAAFAALLAYAAACEAGASDPGGMDGLHIAFYTPAHAPLRRADALGRISGFTLQSLRRMRSQTVLPRGIFREGDDATTTSEEPTASAEVQA